ncbi:aldehyde dehydrogenase family protein [Pradoshia sp. D12]|uniref:aldehyde dehydrogenase family protein n=1 Tax=Bacillaceae TaxID=186817 RepID=UPI00080AE696|nr:MULTISPECIES: aldehyde dehydrogenase family protein [Bacillaceae]OCA86801.1 aldehyde dehydrogenase [Bacillus sp. FJAT-27986]QFK71430.1 aldehyde dehydrogenase family protein [Pradoshia sp. D12]TPF73225.1 aldehyde dehydrogenase family protein [Bacillus sp. D12]
MPVINELKEYKNIINGNAVASSTGEFIESMNPSTGIAWARIPKSTTEDVEYTIQAARNAFPDWAALPPLQRAELLRQIGDRLTDHAEELATLETKDNGWVISNTSYTLITSLKQIWYDAAGLCNYASRGDTIPKGPTTFGYTYREPLGVVVGITPWNAPLFTFTIKAAYALAAGNTVIIKPSEHASVSSLRYGEILASILPPGVINVLSGYGTEIGDALVSNKEINKVSLTGSKATASAITRATANNPKPFIFELGGKSPNIIFEDANLDKVMERLLPYSIFTGNAGQICVAGSRILIQKSIFEEVIKGFKQAMESVKLGNTLNMQTTMGPIGNLSQYKKVISYIELGEKEGDIIAGGKSGGNVLLHGNHELENGYWVEPTLIKVDNHRHRVCQEEIFGPVAVVIPFETEEEAIAIANDTDFGLAAGIWTTDLARAKRLISKIDAGNVWVNTYSQVGIDLPFGGFKDSGFGTDSFIEYTREKACVIEIG